jgi:DNA polymerase III subunit alpha
MKDRKSSSIPFVGLHAHSVAGSIFDAIGYPQEHMDFAYENGSTALALTDHGNMNGLAYQVLHAKAMQSQGKDFKPIFGVEAYFIPSISGWKEDYERIKKDAALSKGISKEEASGTTVEDEGESKKAIKSTLNRRRHLILLAQNQKGLNNIFKIISESYKEENFYRYPRVDYEMLSKYGEGIIAASACLGGVYAGNYWENRDQGEEAVLDAMRETTRRMTEIFGDRWYGELQWNNIPEQHELNQYVVKMHKEFDIKLISTADSHYPSPDAWKDRELYKRLGWLGKSKPDWAENTELPPGVEEIGYELYPKNGDQIWESYKAYSESCEQNYDDKMVMDSITNTHQIAYTRIDSFMPDATVRLPDFVVPEGATADETLDKYAFEGLRTLGYHEDQCYVDRLRVELDVICERGFSKYFLTMKAIADRANDVQLTGPGRGSGAGSLVAYSLGITQIDPIKWGLLFERFLRRDAKDYPDIDYDVSDPMALKEVLIEEWGDDKVVPISNWNTLQLRSLIKDISKFYGIPFTEVNQVTGKMLFEAIGPAKRAHGIKAGVYTPTFEEVMLYSKSLKDFLQKYPQVKTHVEALHGQTRSASRHAGGIVVGKDLDSWMPLINSKGIRQTPWSEGQNVRHLEPMGFIKFDILGLASLRMIEGAIRHILKDQGVEDATHKDVKEYYDKHLHPDNINFSDKNVWKNVFHKGKWAGVFQFTETGAQEFCQRAKPTSLIDLAAITSIYRPGPLSAGVDKKFVEAKERPMDIRYLNEAVQDVTEETYGFLIFQEQIAMLAHRLGKDLSLDEGNLLRKVLTKKGTGKGHEVKDSIYKKFIEGCTEKGIQSGQAEKLWQTFEYFSGYGFNKSHAVSYCVLSYQCAWLLNYYPAEWMAAFLDKEPEGRKEKAINVAKKFGFEIEPLNINTSGTVWEISEDGKTLIQPLTSIKGLGEAAIAQILDNRPFENIEDFIFNENITYSKLNKKGLDVLIRSQAANCLLDERFANLKHFWASVAVERPKNRKKLNENIEFFKGEEEFSSEEKIQYLVDLTGVFPIDLVLNGEVREKLENNMIPPLGEYDPDLQLTWFIPRKVVKRQTKNGSDYYIVEVIDSTSTVTKIKCWGVRTYDNVYINRPYMAKLDYDEQWGFSTRSIKHNFRLLG